MGPRFRLEPIEDRLCPSGGYLVVGSFANNGVLRYGEDAGAFSTDSTATTSAT